MSTLEELQGAFRLADAFDIAFVALFLYALFTWFRRADIDKGIKRRCNRAA